jgi:hypothetical protein
VTDSMWRDQMRRYDAAFYYAVIDRDLTLSPGDQFADWWVHSGWMFHSTMGTGSERD